MRQTSDLFRKNLKEMVHKKGLSMREVAIKAEMDPSALSKITTGRNDPTLDTIDRLAKGIGVEAWKLLQPNEDTLEARLAALEAKVSAKPSNLIEKLVAVAERAHNEDVENVIRLLEDLIAHYEPAHKKGTA
jgi:transcriptional regulator with XRE-family HTH domain